MRTPAASLHGRLSAALLVLLLILGLASLASTLTTTELYRQAVAQSLHRNLAQRVASAKHETLMTAQGELRRDGLDQLFHWLMAVNPAVEFYVLDTAGRILAYDPTLGPAQLERVDLAPIQHFLRADQRLPILGDDPRHPRQGNIFSVAPIPPEGPPGGYLYVVLAGQQAESAAQRLRSSYILRLGIFRVLASLALAALAGVLLFAALTRPLRRLARRMARFRSGAADRKEAPRAAGGDEVALLSSTFESMAERIHRQVEEMERLERQRRELVANVSHDLRTPIASLRGYLETLSLKREILSPEEREEYLDVALRQSERLGKLVEELFELTKLDHIDDGDALLRREEFSLAELIQDNVQRYQLQAGEQGLRLEASLDGSRSPVLGDLGMMERVLENLIENALRHTPPGGSVTVHLSREGDRAVVRVRDTGRGISQQELPRIFDRFYRSSDAISGLRQGDGNGLGLAIARRILELHGGSIDASSVTGEGTVFTFALRLGDSAGREKNVMSS